MATDSKPNCSSFDSGLHQNRKRQFTVRIAPFLIPLPLLRTAFWDNTSLQAATGVATFCTVELTTSKVLT
jgi:hypothetical protein